jgi:hypothetical protein
MGQIMVKMFWSEFKRIRFRSNKNNNKIIWSNSNLICSDSFTPLVRDEKTIYDTCVQNRLNITQLLNLIFSTWLQSFQSLNLNAFIDMYLITCCLLVKFASNTLKTCISSKLWNAYIGLKTGHSIYICLRFKKWQAS